MRDFGHGLRWRWRAPKPKPVPAPVVPPPAPKVCDPVFRGLSAWVGNLDDLPPDFVLPLLQRNGFQAIVVKVAHGLNPVGVDMARLKVYRDAGIRALSWSWCDAEDPFGEGQVAAARCELFGFAAHWANAEKAYDLTAPDGLRDPAAFARSRQWLDGWNTQWRALGIQPVPLAVSPEPFSGMDHTVWIGAGAAVGFQAYTAENGATIPSCVDWHAQHGWQAGQMVPLIEPRFQGRETLAADYVRAAKALRLPGLCLYPADQLLDRPDIWDAIGSAWR